MAVMYNNMNVDEQYVSTLEPNLYYNPVLVPGVTCSDEFSVGPAGQLYVHKLSTSAAQPGKPGRDFTDEATADSLIPIQLNNNFQKSKKIYGVQAAAVAFDLAEEQLSIATKECGEGWMQSGLGCLVQEGTAAALTSAITDVKDDIVKTRTEIIKAKGRVNVVMCSPEFYAQVLLAAGKEFTPQHNDRVAETGNVGSWLGMLFVEANGLTGSITYYDSTGTLKTVDCSKVQYVMYYHETLKVVTNFETARIVDSENFVGSKAQVELNTGYKVSNPALIRVRKVAA